MEKTISKKMGRPRKYPNLADKYDLTTKEGMRGYAKELRASLPKYQDPKYKEKRREYRKRYYREHKKEFLEYGRKSRAEYKDKLFRLLGNCCQYCGETERVCLVVHHIDSSLKVKREESCNTKYRHYLKYIDNLLLLCANCHHKLHGGIIKYRN